MPLMYLLSRPIKLLARNIHANKTCKNSLRGASSASESFLSGTNANFLESQYQDWSKGKVGVEHSVEELYASVNSDALVVPELSLSKPGKCDDDASAAANLAKNCPHEHIKLYIAVQNLIRSYQVRGHLMAKIDPLKLQIGMKFLLDRKRTYNPHMSPADLDGRGMDNPVVARELGLVLKEEHMDLEFILEQPRSYLQGSEKKLTLREIIKRLEKIYCGPLGIEYMHIYDFDEVHFLRERMETPGSLDFSTEEKRIIMRRLTKAVFLEKYFARKWPAEKRFGLEGGESMIAMLEEIVDHATRHNVKSILIGMQHRGRLNMLVNVCRKPLVDIFAQFKAMQPRDPGSGDMKYHLGTSIQRFIRRTNKYIKVMMSANPSHLEVVSPVVVGKTRAEQYAKGDAHGDMALCLVMHGDAAFCGQGVVYETILLSDLPAFTTHGNIHIVCNNQIGYTTDPRYSRSSPYCSDCGKTVNAPVIHVNGDQAEAVAAAGRIAIEYRMKFKKDIILDLVCYRRHGHSEEDEPMYTQPIMYKKIKAMKTVDQIYAEDLMSQGIITQDDIKMWEKEYTDTLNTHFEMSKKITTLSIVDWVDTAWTGFFESRDPNVVYETGISDQTIETITNVFCHPPPKWAFTVHPGIMKVLDARTNLVKNGMADWAIGEALAYGSLLRENIHIRFTGEDVERGTLAHRHHVLHCQDVDGARHHVLDVLYPDQAEYHLHNSPLSEFGVLGFETGYSYCSPYQLVIWEAQYGDFCNTGQPVFDTFISNAESKWVNMSGLVVQLPHGLDGGGPEHSSARIERFLVMCDEEEDAIPNLDDKDFVLKQLRACNWIIANPTNAANYFHLIRRQICLPFRKPLIIMTPKIGLKSAYFRSPLADFKIGTEFQRCYTDDVPKNPKCVKKVMFCSGKVFQILHEIRKEAKQEDVMAIVRVEQVYPFPYDRVLKEACKFEKAKVFWVQEEHKNQGCWLWVKPRMENLLGQKVTYIGRPSSAAGAAGIKWLFSKEAADFKEAVIKA